MRGFLNTAVGAACLALFVLTTGARAAEPAGGGDATAARIEALFPRDGRHDFAMPMPGTYALPVIRPAGDGAVLDSDGRSHRLRELMRGRITVLSFIYTLCSDADGCPLATATMAEMVDASREFPDIAANARFLSLSFDPTHDRPAALRAYAAPFLAGPHRREKIPWGFLTTASEAALRPILSAYGQTIDRQADGETISHLLRVYLIDRRGRVRNIYGLNFLDPRLLFTDIRTLLLEERAAGGAPDGRR